MLTEQELINLQASGLAATRQQAQQAIYAAKDKTPEDYRHLYYSKIRFVHDGYEWWWVLR